MDWITEYFVNPLARPNDYAPYNAVNTVVFAALALLAAFLIYKGLQRARIKIGAGFYWAILPFIVFGGALRVWEDAHWLPRSVEIAGTTIYPFVTPYIYVLTFLVVVAGIAFAKKWGKRRFGSFDGALFNFGAGAAIVAFLPLILLFKNWAFFLAIGSSAAIAAFFLARLDFWRRIKTARTEGATFFAQCLDGAATFWGVQFGGYGEQHVFGNFLFSLGGPLLFFLVKIAFVYAAAEVFRRELDGKKKESEARTYLLLLITIFGLAPGVRDVLRITCGV